MSVFYTLIDKFEARKLNDADQAALMLDLVPVTQYADDTAAKAGGVVVGGFCRKADGTIAFVLA